MNVPRAHEPGSAALAADEMAACSMLIRFGMHPGAFTSRLRGFQPDPVQIERGRFTADGTQAVVGKTLLGRVQN